MLRPGGRHGRDALPGGQEPGQRRCVDRFDLAPQACQRPAPEDPEHLRVAPLALGAAGPELAQEDRPGVAQPSERLVHDPHRQPPPAGRLDRQERTVGAGPAREQAPQRVVGRPEERDGCPRRRLGARGIAVAAGVLHRDPARQAGDPHRDGAARPRQRLQPFVRGGWAAPGPGRDLVLGQIAEAAQEVGDLVDGARLPLVEQRLQALLGLVERRRVEELAELFLAEQLPEEIPVERERLGPALRERRVAFVHVGGDVVEQERRGHRGRRRRLHAVDADLAPPDPAQHVAQGRQVEDVGQALPVGFHEDREAPVPAGDGEQVGGPLALLPEGGAGARPATRQEKRPAGVLAEAGGEERRAPDRGNDQVLDRVRVGEERLLHAVEVALRQADRDPVVRPDGGDLLAEQLAQASLDRQRPGSVDAAAERRQQDQPPVTQLVAEALDHHPAVGGQGAGCHPLVLEVTDEVLGGQRIEVVPLSQSIGEDRPAGSSTREVALRGADEAPQRAAQLDRPADGIPLPERQLPGLARGGDHDHALRGDLGDPPAAGPQHDHVAVHPRAELVDHLLVELTDAATRRARLARHEDAEQAPVRDRPARRDRHHARVPPALDGVSGAIPDDARLQLRELVGGVRPGEHGKHAFEDLAGQRLERRRPRDRGQQVVHGPAVHHRHRHELLGQHVERVAGDQRGLDRAFPHPLGDHGTLQQVAPVLREDHAATHLVDVVPGPPDALEPAGDRGRRLDLDDQVDRAHVDPQLERRGRHERGQPAVLQRLFDRDPLLAGDRAVVRADQLLAGQLVQALREALGQAPAVDEDQRAPVGPDQLEDARVDRRPDAHPPLAAAHRAARLVLRGQGLAETAHVLHGDDDLEVERLARPGIHQRHAAALAAPSEEAPDRLQRALGGREADPLERRCARGAQAFEAFEAQGQVRAALRAGDRVDFVDDHVLHAPQDLARLRGQQKVERLGRGDEDLGWMLRDKAPFRGRRVARARGDRDGADRAPESFARQRDAGQGRPEVALHVVGERLERADVQDPHRARAAGHGRAGGR